MGTPGASSGLHTHVCLLHICVHLRAQSVESRSTKVGSWPWAAGQTALDSRPFPKDNVQPVSEAPSSLLPQPSLWGAGEWEVTLANLLCYQPLALAVRLPVWQLLVSPAYQVSCQLPHRIVTSTAQCRDRSRLTEQRQLRAVSYPLIGKSVCVSSRDGKPEALGSSSTCPAGP